MFNSYESVHKVQVSLSFTEVLFLWFQFIFNVNSKTANINEKLSIARFLVRFTTVWLPALGPYAAHQAP